MSEQSKKGITSRSSDYSQWYLDVIAGADLAEHAPVKGCMVIKPYGYALWENIQRVLDEKIKETGHENAYFPLFIPKSFLNKEAGHVKFAKECAVVTHYRLKSDPDLGIIPDPEARLEEELIVRPTSETIMYAMFSKWINSWRDLPLLLNQWANIVRFEMRTRLFLRTTEFLWQEGHTAHRSEEEAEEEARKMLEVYRDFTEQYLAMSPVSGEKSESEKFPGALHTYTIEAMMQDGKALQAGTSHNLGQNFARAFDIMFTDQDGERKYVWQTSWGVSTRLIGALIMSGSDDKGLVLPPKIAPVKAVIIPIWKTDEERALVLSRANSLQKELGARFSKTVLDERDYCTPGAKFNEWEKKGVPIRIEIGPRDISSGRAVVVERDTGNKEEVELSRIAEDVSKRLELMQGRMAKKSKHCRESHSKRIDRYSDFLTSMESESGFIYSHWCGAEECEKKITDETKATIRCVPFDEEGEKGECVVCKSASEKRALFAKAY
ncbi:MAG: proline--tRNA ligase [Candidatus Jacksonbacteria bacterium]|nr:proline--tRNA ligase [Candidatus Jacksonbacteria bacterium]